MFVVPAILYIKFKTCNIFPWVIFSIYLFKKCLLLGKTPKGGARKHVETLYISGWTKKDGCSVWIVDQDTLQPKRKMDTSMLDNNTEKVLGVKHKYLMVHEQNTPRINVFKLEQFQYVMEAQLPKHVTQFELVGDLLFMGALRDRRVYAYKTFKDDRKYQFEEPNPVWGPRKNYYGSYAQIDSKKILVTDPINYRRHRVYEVVENLGVRRVVTFLGPVKFRPVCCINQGIVVGRDHDEHEIVVLKIE